MREKRWTPQETWFKVPNQDLGDTEVSTIGLSIREAKGLQLQKKKAGNL